ncbi:hypothetical protein M9458_001537, partial [Cirrhinus mrigala]
SSQPITQSVLDCWRRLSVPIAHHMPRCSSTRPNLKKHHTENKTYPAYATTTAKSSTTPAEDTYQ